MTSSKNKDLGKVLLLLQSKNEVKAIHLISIDNHIRLCTLEDMKKYSNNSEFDKV